MCAKKLAAHYKVSLLIAQMYINLRLEGYPRQTALKKAGLAA
jgi:hypothetical protein